MSRAGVPGPAQELRRLALSLLVGGPYSTDGVPAGLVCASWPDDDGVVRRARTVGRLVTDLVETGQVSLLDVRYASARAMVASTRRLPVDEVERDPARLFPVVVPAAVPPGAVSTVPVLPVDAAGWIPHLFAEEPLDALLWPEVATRTPDVEGRARLAVGLARLHAVCVAASSTRGPGADLDGRLADLLALLSRARFVGAEPPRPAVSAVMMLLSAVVGAEGADVTREVAGVLELLRARTGWVPSDSPWRAPEDLFGADAWLTLG
ncbi:hypothetical protein ACFP63_15980 [Oerskovia jenensis]|uniref:Aminoglycoside phosphotransferase domain-containing protein n=1 Tax=Oerskovia jenensis TaxID=162169 RepID=A0ABS2LDX3_9CELL|nr:hypothetical protein [Oerskovia jenensis]MBM7478625.1 hypothetical protein [Oerskovia jenensis]